MMKFYALFLFSLILALLAFAIGYLLIKFKIIANNYKPKTYKHKSDIEQFDIKSTTNTTFDDVPQGSVVDGSKAKDNFKL